MIRGIVCNQMNDTKNVIIDGNVHVSRHEVVK